MVFNNGTSSALDGKDAGDLQNDIYETLTFGKGKEFRNARTLGRSPASNFSGKVYTDNLGALKLPRNICHDVDSISTTNTTSDHTQTTRVRGVRVGTDHKSTREGIVFQNDLVDDTRARLPETETILGSHELIQ